MTRLISRARMYVIYVYSREGASCVGRPIWVGAVLAPLRRVNKFLLLSPVGFLRPAHVAASLADYRRWGRA